MIIVEELDKLIEKRGWYLHRYEFLKPGEINYFRCMIRFPCRPPVFCAIINDYYNNAGHIMSRVDKFLKR